MTWRGATSATRRGKEIVRASSMQRKDPLVGCFLGWKERERERREKRFTFRRWRYNPRRDCIFTLVPRALDG